MEQAQLLRLHLLLLLLMVSLSVSECEKLTVLFKNDIERHLRNWRTLLFSQFSTKTNRIVVAFKSPPYAQQVDRFRLWLLPSKSYKSYTDFAPNDRIYVQHFPPNYTVISLSALQINSDDYRISIELCRMTSKKEIQPIVLPSTQQSQCTVALNWNISHQAIRLYNGQCNATLPGKLQQLLSKRYGLVLDSDCCLADANRFSQQKSEANSIFGSKTATAAAAAALVAVALSVTAVAAVIARIHCRSSLQQETSASMPTLKQALDAKSKWLTQPYFLLNTASVSTRTGVGLCRNFEIRGYQQQQQQQKQQQQQQQQL